MGCSFDRAEKGLSWTLPREVACWFAMRFVPENFLVLKASITRDQVIYYSEQRSESAVAWGL
jgi:hypothetical protein